MTDNELMLKGLLAIIHRDGGEHTENVGLRQSVADAHIKWAQLQIAAEEKKLPNYNRHGLVDLEPVSQADGSSERDNDDWHSNHG